MSRIACVLGVLVTAGLCQQTLACSGGDDDAIRSKDDDVRVSPTGTAIAASVIVTAPAGVTVEPTTISIARRSAPLGELITPVPDANQMLRMVTSGSGGTFVTTDLPLYVARAQTTTLLAAALSVNAKGGPRTYGLGDLKFNNTFQLVPKDGNHSDLDPLSDGSKSIPLLAGDYEVNFGIGGIDGVSASVDAGEIKSVNVTDPSHRRVGRVRFPVAELPDASCSSDDANYPEWSITGMPHGSVGHATPLPQALRMEPGDEFEIGASPAHPKAAYSIRNVRSWRSDIPVPLGARGAPPSTLALGRIDVDDVSINGGASIVRGTYAVHARDQYGNIVKDNFLKCTPPTNTGVDVPPGSYRIYVFYRTVETGDQQAIYDVRVP
jgi:hypothetical protein